MASSLDLSFCFLISIVLFLLLSLFKWLSSSSYNNNKPQKNLPPSPPKFPILGNLHQLGLLPYRSLQSLSKKYGPVMLLHLGYKPMLVVSSVDAAYHVMKTHDLVFSDRPRSSVTDKLFYNSKDMAFSPYGEYWRQVKSLAMLHLFSNKRVQSFRHVRKEETSLMVEKIRQRCSSSSSSSSLIINLSELFITLANDIVCRVATGRKHSDGEDGRKTIAYLKLVMELLDVFNVGDYIPWLGWVNRFNDLDDKVKKTVKHIDGFLETVIEEHMNCKKIAETNGDDDTSEAKNSDFVDILLEFQRENLTGFALERDALKAIILDMFVAGTHTIHAVLDWAMAELLRNPKILQKLQTEVRQVTQEKSQVTEDDLEKMKYLKAVIKEALRLHTPVPLLLPRQSNQNVKVMGYEISAGTQVVVNAWAIARDPMVWKNPDEFQPERFLSSTIDIRGFNFELIPFGAGRRGCPAINFSMLVIELALANLVKTFDFALPDGIKPHELDMTETSDLSTMVAIGRKIRMEVELDVIAEKKLKKIAKGVD